MDATRFDALARSLTTSRSRRSLSRALAGLTLGGALGSAWLAGAKKKKCKPCQIKKNGKCKGTKPDGTACGGGQTCQSGKCRCPIGTEKCRGECVDLCTAGLVRNTVTCGCCQPSGPPCTVAVHNCCSGVCTPDDQNYCSTRNPGEACDFGGQCTSGSCVGKKCT